MSKRLIVVTGPRHTGKVTLARKLADEAGLIHIDEYNVDTGDTVSFVLFILSVIAISKRGVIISGNFNEECQNKLKYVVDNFKVINTDEEKQMTKKVIVY